MTRIWDNNWYIVYLLGNMLSSFVRVQDNIIQKGYLKFHLSFEDN